MKKETIKKTKKHISERGTAILNYVKEIQETVRDKQNIINSNQIIKDYSFKNEKIYMYGIR